MNSPTPTGAASSTIFLEESKVSNGVHDHLGQQKQPQKFLAKRTPRIRPQFPSASPSTQARLQVPHAYEHGDTIHAKLTEAQPSPRVGIRSQPGHTAFVKNARRHQVEARVAKPAARSQPLLVQQHSVSSHANGTSFIRPSQQPQPRGQKGILHHSSILPYDPVSHSDSQSHRLNGRKGYDATVGTGLTRDDELTNGGSSTADATSVLLASNQCNVSSSESLRTIYTASQSLSSEHLSNDFTKRPTSNTTLHRRKKPESRSKAFHPPSRDGSKVWSSSLSKTSLNLAVTSCEAFRGRNVEPRQIEAGATNDPLEKQEKELFGNLAINDVQCTGSKVFGTNGIRKRPKMSEGICALSKGRRGMNCRSHHDFDLDSVIYGQSGAAPPPPDIEIRRQSPCRISNGEEQRRYVHADPAIHLMHNRSETWLARKALEIGNRPGRKFWFGNVSGRIRWLRANQTLPREGKGSQDTAETKTPPRRPNVQPRVPSRALDFGDVAAKDLPDYVQENPAWLEACEFFRQTSERREAVAHVSKILEREKRDVSETIIHVRPHELR